FNQKPVHRRNVRKSINMRITNTDETTHTISAVLCRLIIISYSKALISGGTKSPLASGEKRPTSIL
ncbi:MAG: hypothetical protein ACYTFQ_30945, partial [Planctomycetota bacterium]